MSIKLCGKCQRLADASGILQQIANGLIPWIHCHHEDEKVTKCQCWTNKPIYVVEGFYPLRTSKADYCPKCGRPLQ